MNKINYDEHWHFIKNIGFPQVKIHPSIDHFDFRKPGRRILVIGPMGSGKTEFSSRIWRDSMVLGKKSSVITEKTSSGIADRRNVFFVRAKLDSKRFREYPEDVLAYRGGYENCNDRIAVAENSFDLEKIIAQNPECGTWIIDETTFYDERIAYLVKKEAEEKGLIFIFPTLILNFRKDIFNTTAQLLLEISTDVVQLTAYCEHCDCMADSFYTYRYYNVDGVECPALYFDPLIVIGGDTEKIGPREPNYCTRCDEHHYLSGKEYTYMILKPLGQKACNGDPEPLMKELFTIKNDLKKSMLFDNFYKKYVDDLAGAELNMNALKVDFIAEKALIYLFSEHNLIPTNLLLDIVNKLELDLEYMRASLKEKNFSLD